VTSSIIPDISWRLSLWAASVGDAPYRAVSIPYGQKLKRPKERRRLSFGCYSLMQHDVRRAVAALAGAAWAWVIAARISRLAELAHSLLSAEAPEFRLRQLNATRRPARRGSA
jgi:hypothetical protein